MSEAKFTPGPWKAFDDGGICSEIIERPIVCEVNQYPREEKHIGCGGDPIANARLIAAAPDLYAACEAFAYGRKEVLEAERMMKAALAKARGE